MLDLLGWIGAICFAVSALPQSIKSWKEGHAEGLAWGMLLLWLVGEVATLVYVVATSGVSQMPLLFNYILNLVFLLVILRYKLFPRVGRP